MTKLKVNLGGRPTDYSIEIAEYICEKISNSEKGLRTLREEDPNFPGLTTIFRWLDLHEEFRKLYARAREAQAEYMRDTVLVIADDSGDDALEIRNKDGDVVGVKENREFVNRSRLRVETRLKLMAKLYPKVYGQDSEKLNEDKKDPTVTIIVKKDGVLPVVEGDSLTGNQDIKK
jgi:hypothetical protein